MAAMAGGPSNQTISDFQSVFEASLSDIHVRTGGVDGDAQRCIILSGGVDTCAILTAARKLGISFAAALTVITGDDSPDLGFAKACAKEHGIPHHVVRLTSDELVSQFLPEVVRLLHIFNGMLIRNSLVIAAVFKKAAELGFKHAVVGDGADELFGGYSFMWGSADDPVEWKKKRDSMCAEWTFSTEELASKYLMTQHSPYTEPRTVEWAIANTERSDCIGVRPIRLLYGGEAKEHETGKVILREAYDTVSSWRRKDPIEVGSGVTVIGHDPYWKDQISDEEFKAETEALLLRGYILDRKEQLANFREFEKCFGRDAKGRDGTGAEIKRLPLGQGCVGCCFEIGDSTFCHMCGAYPAQRDSAAEFRYDTELHKLVPRCSADDSCAVIVTPRSPDTAFNFGPASSRDEILFTCERPGGDPKEEGATISASAVREWAAFMRSQDVKRILILLDDNELAVYVDPGLLRMYEDAGFDARRAPMGEAGASERVMSIVREAEESQERIVAHCTHGMGRSGRVAAGWIAHRYALDPVAATREGLDAARQHGMERLGDADKLEQWLASTSKAP